MQQLRSRFAVVNGRDQILQKENDGLRGKVTFHPHLYPPPGFDAGYSAGFDARLHGGAGEATGRVCPNSVRWRTHQTTMYIVGAGYPSKMVDQNSVATLERRKSALGRHPQMLPTHGGIMFYRRHLLLLSNDIEIAPKGESCTT
eukprot:4702115-Amphidinium_carterae.1